MTNPPRNTPLDLKPEEFRRLGYQVIDQIADFLAGLPQRPVNGSPPLEIGEQLIQEIRAQRLPDTGVDPERLLQETTRLLLDNSLLTAHPRHLAYIIGSPAPIGALADLLAATLNSNVSSWWRSALASEIEAQVIRWLADLVGYPDDCGGLLVSGGSMANYIGLLAARKAKTNWEVRRQGLVEGGCRPLRLYASDQTHAWLEKAADLFGLGTDSIRFIRSDANQRIDLTQLQRAILADRENGDLPLMVVANAGTTATGAVDPLFEIAEICRQEGLWFHIDGAYGAFAVLSDQAPDDLRALALADSLALDPHKWLYQPLEAGCALVRDANLLRETFTYQPPYYRFPVIEGHEPINYYQYGPQNSRGFRALKVWLSLQQAGRGGYQQMISDDICLSRQLYHEVAAHPDLQAFTNNLSITTFRFAPADLHAGSQEHEAYLNRLNDELLVRLQTGGEIYISNAVLGETFLLRACFVNFRTTAQDVSAIARVVAREGHRLDQEIRPPSLS